MGFLGGGADSNDNNLITGNFIHDAGGGGFSEVNDTNIDVTNNTFEDNARYGWQFFGSGSGSSATGNSFTDEMRPIGENQSAVARKRLAWLSKLVL